MTRFLFVSLPLAGHIDWGGMAATAGELAAQPDHAVAWASGRAVAPALARAGVELLELEHAGWIEPVPLPADLPAAEAASARRERALDAWLAAQPALSALSELERIAAGWQPDVIVSEPYAAAAALLAERRGLLLAVCGRPALAAQPGRPAGPAGRRVSALCRAAGVAGDCWDTVAGQIRSPWLHVDFFSRRWYDDLQELGAQTRFFGAAAPASPPGSVRTNQVLITLGSLFTDDPAFFRSAAAAVLAEGGRPLVVTGQRGAADAAASLGLPSGVEVADWVDFDAVLPGAAGIIHHGGVGTTHAALRHGAPQVAVPHAGDQLAQAGRITLAKVGYGVRPADFTADNARWFARQLLANGSLRAAARGWQAELASLGGPAAAAAALLEALVDEPQTRGLRPGGPEGGIGNRFA